MSLVPVRPAFVDVHDDRSGSPRDKPGRVFETRCSRYVRERGEAKRQCFEKDVPLMWKTIQCEANIVVCLTWS